MNSAEVHGLFEDHGALRRGHYHLSSGLHSDTYAQCALVLQWPGIAERLGHELGSRFGSLRPTVVLGPAMGGIVIGHEVARYLGVRSIFSERVEGRMALRRGFGLESSDRVVVCEDVITTGRSPAEATELVAEAGATLIGVGTIIDRSSGVSFGVHVESLLRLDAAVWEPGDCPLCASGEELTSPGSRRLVR
jgi:orotate phosphoribosyltransferase